MTILRTNPCEGPAGQTVVFVDENADSTSVGTLTYVAGGKVGSTAAQVAAGSTSFFQNVVTGSYTGFWFRAPSLPTGDNTFAYALNGSTGVAAVGMLATGEIRLYSILSTTIATTTATCSGGAWYYADWRADGSSGAPQQTFRLYDAAGVIVETLTGAVFGTVAPDRWRHGHPQGGKQAGPIDFDNIRIADAYTGFPASPPAATVRPTAASSNPGAWVTNAGAAPSGAALADESDASYVTNPGTAATEAVTYALGSLIDGPISLYVRALKPSVTVANLKVELLEGVTVRASRVLTSATATTAYDAGIGIADYVIALTAAENTAVTSRTALALRLTANGS